MDDEQKQNIQQSFLDHPIDSIAKLREVFHKWLEYEDETLLNLIVGIRVYTEWMGEQWLYPLWLAVLGSSGNRKTETVGSLCDSSKIIEVELITENTFVTGNPKFSKHDLAPQLKNKLMVTLDFAPLLNKDSRILRAIMSQLRLGYDGKFYRRTGSGVSEAYKDIYFNWILCSTSSYDKSEVIRSEIGQRELVYRLEYEHPKPDMEKVKAKIKYNTEHLEEMRFELQTALNRFVDHWKENKPIRYNDIGISNETNKIIEDLCSFIVYLRASVELDNYDKGDPKDLIEPEEPTRVYGQLCGWYRALKGIGLSEEETIKILKDIAKSSINRIRFRILKNLKNLPCDVSVPISYLTRQLGLGFKSVNGELMTLFQLKIVDFNGQEGEKRTWKIKEHLDKDKKEMLDFIFLKEDAEPENLTEILQEVEKKTPTSETEVLMKVLAPRIPMTYDNILEQTNGSIQKERVLGLLQKLENDGIVFRPDGFSYQLVK